MAHLFGADFESFQYINTLCSKVTGGKIQRPAKMFQVRNEGQERHASILTASIVG